MSAVYLDHAATSPLHPKVLEAMNNAERKFFGNPSSIHRFGREARRQLEEARAAIAESIGANESEIIFTSGGTEAANLAIIGTALRRKHEGRHIVTTAIEHHAVLNSCKFLKTLGFEVTYAPVQQNGVVLASDIVNALRDDTILVSVMFGNNEIGTLQPISEIGQALQETDALFHTDAVQAFGMMRFDVKKLHVDLLSVSAHKINGPKGTGFLFAKEGVNVSPLMHGGEQEKKRRAGTENVAGIVGMHTAIQLSQASLDERRAQYESFRKKMLAIFEQHDLSFVVNGGDADVLPHILNVSFPDAKADALLASLDLAGVAASSGSACTAGTLQPSHVLQAMFKDDEKRVESAIRFSFGLGNTMADIEKAAYETVQSVKRITGR